MADGSDSHAVLSESIKKEESSVRCSLKIEVIDDTAMIDISQTGKKINGKLGTRNKKKKNANHQEIGNGSNIVQANVPISEKRVYCRKELENLRFVGMEQQRKMWVEVYCGLGHTVKKEYDALLHSNAQKHIPRRHLGKENSPLISGILAAKERGKHMKVYTQRGMTYMNLQNTLCLPGH